jgi:hypothetical protein
MERMALKRRAFLETVGAGLLGTGLAHAQAPQPRQGSAFLGENTRRQAPPIPVKKIKTVALFKSPEMYPNGIAVAPEGLWIAEQKSDNAVLTDWEGKLLKTIKTPSKNSSGIAFGGGRVWMAANRAPNGIYEIDLNGNVISHRQIPLGPEEDGGGCHGIEYVDGKLYIAALRLRGILRVDVKTWQPEFFINYNVPRAHGMAYDKRDNSVWLVTGLADGSAGLIQYDAATGRTMSTAAFDKTMSDPHGLAWYNGALYSSDAGIHPGWEDDVSPTHGYIFRIDFV